MAVLPHQYRRDFTSIFMNIKAFIKPIQNARILSCMLRFFVGSRLDEHLNLKRSDAKSRWVAGPLDVIYYF
jgi:hypothetical protein